MKGTSCLTINTHIFSVGRLQIFFRLGQVRSRKLISDTFKNFLFKLLHIIGVGWVRLVINSLLQGERGWVDDLLFFEYLSPFCFLSIEFRCTFSIYKILPYFVYYYSILIKL